MASCRFNIIIPNYNNAEWLDKMFSSIYNQTYPDYNIIFVDDCSTDNSVEKADQWRDKLLTRRDQHEWNGFFEIFYHHDKRWNGGARNIGIKEVWDTSGYTLFLDSDDWLSDNDCLKDIAEAIEANNYPDLLRLSYYILEGERLTLVNMSDQQTVARIVSDMNVACWTKCVKSNLVVPFPENTLMEDVVQHIAQLDKVDTVANLGKGIVVWNRNNANSCSRDETLQNGKWRSSLYRYYADLLDLKVKKPECQAELERRRAIALDNIKNDRFVQ